MKLQDKICGDVEKLRTDRRRREGSSIRTSIRKDKRRKKECCPFTQ